MWQERLVFNLANGTTLVVTQANIWQGGLTVEQSVSSDGFFEIGSTHIGQMTATLYNSQRDVLENADFSLSNEGHLTLEGEPVTYDVVYDAVDFQNAVVTVSMAKDSDTLQQMGIYTVVRSERDNGILGITAYDNMTLLSEPYTTSLSYPSTYGAMVHEIVGTTIQFDGSTTAVQSAPEFEAETTKREVLGYIAQACGYNVMCDENGQYKFVRFNMAGFNTQGAYHEISSLFDFHHSHYPVVITGAKVIVKTIVSTTDPDTGETTAEEVVNTYTSGTDDYQIVIEGNPLITTANGQAVANTIFATFGGVEFYTGSVSHLSDLSIKASDIMKVTDRTGTTYPMLVSSTQISTGSPQLSQSFAEEPASKLSVQPSIIDRVQTSVRQALLDAQNSMNKANHASQIAGNTNQYFWHTETGTDTGAHITEIPQEDFLADPTNGGGNLLARSNGIAVRDGLTELSSFSDGDIQLGPDSDYHVNIQPQGIDFYTANGATPISSINVKVEGNKQNTCQYYDNEDVYILGGHGRQSRAGRYINDLQLIASGMSTDNRESEILLSQISDLGSASIAMSNGAISISGQSIIFVNPITANAVQSYTPTWATNQSPANYHCVVSAGLCSFFYQGLGGTHSNETLLGTLPTGAKPKSIVFCPCVKGANAYGLIRVETNGNIYLAYISSTSATARLYFNCSFPVV